MPPDDNPYGDDYSSKKYRSYDERAVRYRLAADMLIMYLGFEEDSSLLDLGGGQDEEFARCLRDEYGWRGNYKNWDLCKGSDILTLCENSEKQALYRGAYDYVTALEVIEHFPASQSIKIVDMMKRLPAFGSVISTPNAMVTDVISMDETHKIGWNPAHLRKLGFTTEQHMLYDGYYNWDRRKNLPDGIMAWYGQDCHRVDKAQRRLRRLSQSQS